MTTVMVLVALLVPMQAAPPAPLAPELAAARAQILEGRPDSALEQLARMPADAPPVRYLTGLAYYHRDDHVRAIEYLAPVAQTLAAGSLERREAIAGCAVANGIGISFIERGEPGGRLQ